MLFETPRSLALEGDVWILGASYRLPEGTLVFLSNRTQDLLHPVNGVLETRTRRNEGGRVLADMVFVQKELSGNRLALPDSRSRRDVGM